MTMLAQSDDLRKRAEEKLLGRIEPSPLAAKRGPDRRKRPDPVFQGPERRKRGERRRVKS